MTQPDDIQSEIAAEAAFIEPLREEIARVLIGQDHLVNRMLICLLTGDHLLVEGLPGLAKTLAITTLSQTISAAHGRIQFTPDLLPADVIGTNVYNPSTQEFTPREGPVFTNLLLADEINRAPAKVQSALLEAMQERQVTLGGATRALPSPFLVMATQNPLDQEGTYPLPEAQMDRFMMKVLVTYPSRDEEREVLQRMAPSTSAPTASPVVELETITKARDLADRVHMDTKIEEYLLDLVLATRPGGQSELSDRQSDVDLSFMDPLLAAGASPRATLMLARGARALAFLDGRAHVLPEDIKSLAPDILRHRLIPTYEAQAENQDADAIITRLLDTLHTRKKPMSNLITTELMEKVRRIEIRTRRIVQNRTAGAYHASFKGQGIEFAEVREFQEGDDIRAIDANVSARFGHPYIKLFTEEREQNVFLLVDRSASGHFGSTDFTKTEYAAEVAAVLAFSATLNKDRVGLMLFTDREELHLKPARGHRHVLRIIRELLAFETSSPHTDLALGMQRLLETNPRRSIVFILSDLMTGDFERPLGALARKHEVILIHISDPLERSLPPLPALSLEDLETGEVVRLPSRHARTLAARSSDHRAHARTLCNRAGIDFVALDTATDYVPELIGLFARRMARRQ